MDAFSDVKRIKMRKSPWAKRSSTPKFSPTGALTGYASTAAAAGAAFAETVQAVPATVASSLEQSKKITTRLTHFVAGRSTNSSCA